MRYLYSFVRVLIAKYHKLSSFINSSVSSYSSGGWKSKLEGWWCCFLLRAVRETVLVLSIVSARLLVIIHVPWLLSYHFNLCLSLHMVENTQSSPSYKDIGHIGFGPTLFQQDFISLKSGITLFSNKATVWRYWGSELQHIDFFFGGGGHNSTSNSTPVRQPRPPAVQYELGSRPGVVGSGTGIPARFFCKPKTTLRKLSLLP